jgi:hypothetical protein
MKSYIVGVCALFAFLVVPSISEAYKTTGQTATDLGNGNALFTITYTFGFLNREVYMPILANRNKEFTDAGQNAGYAILFDGKNEAKASSSQVSSADAKATFNYTVLPGKSKAIVVSDAQIKDNRYYVPEGKTATFTLVALVDLSKSAGKNDISLLMTSLPFTMIDDGKSVEARLNPTELQYFKTPEVTLK